MSSRASFFVWILVALLVPASAALAAPASLIGAKSWSSPTATTVALSFSQAVAHVAPDSGVASSVWISVPGEAVALGPGAPSTLRVNDGVIDSVVATTGVDGARIRVWFADSLHFRVYSLPAQGDQPYRLMVEAKRPGGDAAESARLAGIANKKKQDRVRIVAIDAGHGGEDTGAKSPRGVGIVEKNVTLGVARALADELNHTPGIRAALTRDGDYFVPLRERYHIAEKMKADLFISIHANSTKRRGSGSGTEVYFLSLRGAGDQADADLANVENAADLVGGVPPQTENDLVNILYDVKRSSALQQSQLLAESVLDQIASDQRLESRGVKQAGFVVLKSVEFPSILVETAFINNPKEAQLLKSKDFQSGIAKQIADGVRAYFKKAGIPLSQAKGGEGE